MAIIDKSCSVFILILLSNFISIKSFIHSAKPSPIILVPGDGGSRAYNYNKHAIIFKNMLIWANPYYFLLPKKLNEIFKLEYDPNTHQTRNAKNRNILFPDWGSTKTIETLNDLPIKQSIYYGNFVNSLVKDKYYTRNKTIRGAPYDFRKAPNENNNFVINLKRLIEETYTESGNERVVLLSHSLGCLYSMYFLNKMDISWKKKYLRTYISVSAPLGGSVDALLSLTAGEMMYNDSKDIINTWESPEGIDEIYCIYSKGLPTSKQLIFTTFSDMNPKIQTEDGDGTVSIRSLEICRTWKNTRYEIFKNKNHIDLIKSSDFIDKIKTILYNPPNYQFQFNENPQNIL